MRLAELWRYPVKSLGGERLDRAELGADGIAGDRLARIDGERGPVTARTKQALIGLRGGLGAAGEPLVEGEPWDGPAAAAAVREVAGPEARLSSTAEGKRFDDSPILVATDGALAALGEDRRRFRPSIVLCGVEGLAEWEWPGRRLRIGAAVLAATHRCERCAVTTIDPDSLTVDPGVLRRVRAELGGTMGVYCRVAVPGEVAVGDPVRLVD